MIHELPIGQLLALAACTAYTQGMEPADGTYEDREFGRAMERVKSRRSPQSDQKST